MSGNIAQLICELGDLDFERTVRESAIYSNTTRHDYGSLKREHSANYAGDSVTGVHVYYAS